MRERLHLKNSSVPLLDRSYQNSFTSISLCLSATFLTSANAFAGDGNLGPLIALLGTVTFFAIAVICFIFAKLAPAGQRIAWAVGVLITLLTIVTRLSALAVNSTSSRVFVGACCLFIISSGIALLMHVRKNAGLKRSSSNTEHTDPGVAIARLVAWLFTVGCLTQLVFYFDLAFGKKSLLTSAIDLNYLLSFFSFIVSGFCVYGLWKLKIWGWWLTLALTGVAFFRFLIFQITSIGSNFSSISISTLSLVFILSLFNILLPALLLLPKVRKAFETSNPQRWQATEISP
jgi:hypothetical protein